MSARRSRPFVIRVAAQGCLLSLDEIRRAGDFNTERLVDRELQYTGVR